VGAAKEGEAGAGNPRHFERQRFNHVASDATGISALAERYAAALYDLASGQNAIDAVLGDLAGLRGMLAQSAELRRVTASPVLKRATQEAAIGAVAAQAGFSPLVQNFLRVLARNRRLSALPAIVDAFNRRVAASRGEITARVTTAQALSDAQIAALEERLKRSLGTKVALDIWIDPAIVGGLVVKVGSKLIDGSLRSKLQRLQLALKGI
jgi:F-type H+-transporting ATPase subunit delta